MLPLLILGGTVVGGIGKYIYDYSVRYSKAEDKNIVKWDWKEFWLTVVVSIVTALLLYRFVFEQVSKLSDKMLVFSISTQIGFVSQFLITKMFRKLIE